MESTWPVSLRKILENVYPVGIVVWCKDSSACPKIGTWAICTELIGRYPLGDSTGGLEAVKAGLPEVRGLFAGVGHADSSTYGYQSYATGAIRYAFDGGDTSITGNYLGVKVTNDTTSKPDDIFSFRASDGELKPEFYNATNSTLANKPNDVYVGSENSVFGKSNTVTPPSAKLIPYIRTA